MAEPLFLSYFDSRWLWALQPILSYGMRYQPMRFLDGNLVIEPCVEGGVMLVAISGHAMAVVRDPHGFANGTATLSLPDAIFDACKPSEPVNFEYCGEVYPVSVPEWMQPGAVCASRAGIFVQPKMRAPAFAEADDPEFHPCLFNRIECGNVHSVGFDYRCVPGAKLSWRQALRRATDGAPGSAGAVSPEIVGLFGRMHDLLREASETNPHVFHTATEDDGPVLVQFEGFPDVIGTYMPQSPGERTPVARWFEKQITPGVAAEAVQ